MAKAELCVYSGSQNPSFELTEDEKKLALEYIASSTVKAKTLPTRLGYSGVLVLFDAGDTVAAVHAYDGVFGVFPWGGEAKFYKDPERRLEYLVAGKFQEKNPASLAMV